MSTIESSITKFARNLIKDKLIGERFNVNKYWDNVSFEKEGRYRIDAVDEFSFVDVRDAVNSSHLWDASIPSYTLRVSGVNLETSDTFSMSISIKDLP